MKSIGNFFWFILIGLVSAISWCLIGVLLCITLIGIPFGKQCFKIAGLVILPFGKDVEINFGKHAVGNVIWIILFGWELALGYLVAGIVFCITIIGIPFGKQCFKLMKLGLIPMGAEISKGSPKEKPNK